jgi:hypothetical protein
MLPAIEIANLKRNILKINLSGNVLEGVLIRTNEEYYLFSKEKNIKEYKIRLAEVLKAIRAFIRNINLSATLDGIINETRTYSAY